MLSNNHPGPVGKPFVNFNNMRIPSTPVHYHYPQPTTNLEAQQAMKDLYKFPLSVYLCSFADIAGKVMYTYSYFWSIDQSVPCPDDKCQFPDNFEEYLIVLSKKTLILVSVAKRIVGGPKSPG